MNFLGINFHLPKTFDECVVTLPALPDDLQMFVSADPDAGPSALEDESMGFIYLDVGAWVGDSTDPKSKRRDFAIAHNNWVALCEFGAPGTGNVSSSCLTRSGIYYAETARGTTPPDEEEGELDALYELLRAIDGKDKRVKVTRSMKYVGPYPMEASDKPLLLLPDMHMPLVTGYPPLQRDPEDVDFGRFTEPGEDVGVDFAPVQTHITDKASAGRISSTSWKGPANLQNHPYIDVNQPGVNPNDGSYRSSGSSDDGELAPSAKQWFQQYLAAEITKDASVDLLELLSRFGACKDKATLVHLGDLVDFWIGFDCLFEETPEITPNIILKQSTSTQISGQEFLNYWCPRLLDQTFFALPTGPDGAPVMHQYSMNGVNNARALEAMAAAGQPVFLWGNHDNYLADNRSTPSTMQPVRQPFHSQAGLFAEHGHQGDSMNRDGAVDGWRAAQTMMADPTFRAVGDLGVRGPKVEWGATMWYCTLSGTTPSMALTFNRPQKFGVYVMAHSHIPMLGWVTVQIDSDISSPDAYEGPPK